MSLRTSYRRFFTPLAIVIVAVGLLTAGNPSHWVDVGHRLFGDYRGTLVALERKYGMAVEYDDAVGSLPELWRVAPADGQATAIDEVGLSRYARILPVELEKYPPEVIAANLDNIYLMGTLRLFGVDYGGTSLEKSLYLTGGPRVKGYDDHYLESLFHHEFSSILLRQHSFPESRWKALNPTGFEYTENDEEVLLAIASGELKGSETLHQQGFLAEYGRTTLENDFNVYAETVFVDPDRMQSLVNEHRAIREKYKLLKDFYLGVSPDLQDVFARIEGGV